MHYSSSHVFWNIFNFGILDVTRMKPCAQCSLSEFGVALLDL